MKTTAFYTDLRNTIIERLNDYKNVEVYGCDLAYILFESENANGSVLCNTYKTKEFIKNHFDLFADFSEYYKENFGESIDIFSEPERAHVILLIEAAQIVLSNLDITTTYNELKDTRKSPTFLKIVLINDKLNAVFKTDEEDLSSSYMVIPLQYEENINKDRVWYSNINTEFLHQFFDIRVTK